MKVEQAVFTSADNGSRKGYQLVSRSPGIGQRLAQELCRWSPSHASLVDEDSDHWSFNTFPAGDGLTAVARTLHGGPEYSSRGGMQVVTVTLVLARDQLDGYDNDALWVAQTALTLGRLRLQSTFPEQIPAIEFPECPVVSRRDDRGASADPEEQTELTPCLAEALERLLDGRRVAVIGPHDPVASLQQLIARIPRRRRREISFTTGLKPSARRPFQLHFLPAADAAQKRSLHSQAIECLDANIDQSVTPVGT